MNTFNKLWGVVTPAEAQAKIDEQRAVLMVKLQKIWKNRRSLL